MNANIVIKVENLTKIYNLYDKPQDRLKEALNPFGKSYHRDYYALKNINFEIKKGERVGIIGQNGAGKSTLLKIITGVLMPTQGSVKINGKVASLLELGAGFNPEMTGLENVYLNGTLMGFTKEEIDAKIDSILDFADIGDFINQPVKMYSSGMFARLAFSIAINVEPDILIVDEALSVGDVFFQQKCNIYMKEKFSDKTLLIVSHDLSALSALAERSILLEKGSLIYDNTTKTVIEKYLKILHGSYQKKLSTIDMNSNTISLNNNNSDIKYINVNIKKLSGTLDIVIEKIFVNNVTKQTVDFFEPNDLLEIVVVFSAKHTFFNIIFGYIIKDVYGNDIFGENSLGEQILSVHENGIYQLTCQIKWPFVKPGKYTLTVGFGEGNSKNNNRVLCWANNIVSLEAHNPQTVNAYFNIPLQNIVLKEYSS